MIHRGGIVGNQCDFFRGRVGILNYFEQFCTLAPYIKDNFFFWVIENNNIKNWDEW